MNEEVTIKEDLIITNFAAKDSEEVIRTLCKRLKAGGFIMEEYAEAIIDRERVYATGLPTSIPVAIPHADPNLCLKSAIAVAKLSDPVSFGEMGKRDSYIKTQLVIVPAISVPSNQVQMLTRLINFFSDEKAMKELMLIETPKEIELFLKNKLLETQK